MTIFTIFVFVIGLLLGIFLTLKIRTLLKGLMRFALRSARTLQRYKEEVAQEVEDCAVEVQNEAKQAEEVKPAKQAE